MAKNSILDSKLAIPNKLLNKDDSITDLSGNSVPEEKSISAYKSKPAIPNKFLNSDGTYSTLEEILAGAGGGDADIFVPVDALPESGEESKIYLVPSKNQQEGNNFEEYLWKDGAWELIGGMSLDLSNYYTIEQTQDYVTTQINESVLDVLEGEY